jgi:hypothetical protein
LGYRPPAPQTQVPQLMQNQPMLLQWFTIEKLSLVVDLNWQQFTFSWWNQEFSKSRISRCGT